MKKIFIILALIYLAATTIFADSINVFYENINGFNVKYVTVDTNDPEVVITTALAQRFPDGLESWTSFMTRLRPDAAINGTYFCPISAKPVGDVVIENQHYYRGVAGTAFCVLPGNKMTMRLGPHQAKANWSDCQTVVCAGPRLLTNGYATISARDEGFRDPRVLGSAPRSAIAWDNSGKLFLLTIEQNISLPNLANVCKKLGASSAMAMDGGNSSGLYANGRTEHLPGSSLANVLCIYKTHYKFYKYAYGLAPNISIKYPAGFTKPPVYNNNTNTSFITALGNFAAGRPVSYERPVPLSNINNQLENNQTPEIFTTDYNQVADIKSDAPAKPAIASKPAVAVKPSPVVNSNPVMKPPAFVNILTEIKADPEIKVEPVADVIPAQIIPPDEDDNPVVDTSPAITAATPKIDTKPANHKIKIIKLEAGDDAGFARGKYQLNISVDSNSDVQLIKLYIDGKIRDVKSDQSFIKYWDTREYTNALHTIEVQAIRNNQIIGKDILRIQVDN